jgi:hypothetical protein
MTISTYTELQTAVANWLHRTDLTATIPDFISMAESRINSDLHAITKETEVTLTTVSGQSYSTLPSDFVSPIALWVIWSTGSIRELLPQMLPENLCLSDTSAAPFQWAIDGATVSYGMPLDEAHVIKFRYLGKLALSASAPTNWLLTNHQDVYLWGALLEAAIFAQDNENIQLYGSKFENSLTWVKRKENRSRQTNLRVDIGLIGGKRSNIMDGS